MAIPFSSDIDTLKKNLRNIGPYSGFELVERYHEKISSPYNIDIADIYTTFKPQMKGEIVRVYNNYKNEDDTARKDIQLKVYNELVKLYDFIIEELANKLKSLPLEQQKRIAQLVAEHDGTYGSEMTRQFADSTIYGNQEVTMAYAQAYKKAKELRGKGRKTKRRNVRKTRRVKKLRGRK